MKRSQVVILAMLVLVLMSLAIYMARRSYRALPPAAPQAVAPATPATPQRKITATLFYVAADGISLQPQQREVTFGEPVSEQARHIIEAQIAPAPQPLVSAVPAGTKLRAVYVSEAGDAFVDVTGEIASAHTGGSLDEIFTVYAIVNALTVNLPAITRVQILVDGKEVDTLAGHVDLRQPLARNLSWVAETKQN